MTANTYLTLLSFLSSMRSIPYTVIQALRLAGLSISTSSGICGAAVYQELRSKKLGII